MKRMLPLLLVLAAGPVFAKDAPVDYRTLALPTGWTENRVEHPTAVAQAIGTRLGASVKRATVRQLTIGGFRVDVNVLTATDAANAKKVADRIIGMRGKDFMRRVGTEVIESANSNNALAAARIFAWLGLEDLTPRTYAFEASLGLMDPGSHDYMGANPVLQRFIAIDQGKDVDASQTFIAEAVKDWTPGDGLTLFTGPRLGHKSNYSFTPTPKSHGATGMATRWTFDKFEERMSIRYIDVKGTAHVRSRFRPEPVEGDKGSTKATKWWPVGDKLIQDGARKLTAGAKTDRERALAILKYVHRGLRFAGQTGSRYGVLKVIEQGHGHCWDKSDVFITLCRAAGMPARQWAGWVPWMNSGHVWAEVRLSGEGWIPVDATTPWLGISHHYVPLFVSDDGNMPIQYLRWPTFTRRR